MLIEISEIFWSTSKLSNVEFKRVVRMKFWFSLLISFKLLNGLKIIIMKRVFFITHSSYVFSFHSMIMVPNVQGTTGNRYKRNVLTVLL